MHSSQAAGGIFHGALCLSLKLSAHSSWELTIGLVRPNYSMKRAALVLGVNRYQDEAIRNLEFAVHDGTELYGFLKHRVRYERVEHLLGPDDD